MIYWRILYLFGPNLIHGVLKATNCSPFKCQVWTMTNALTVIIWLKQLWHELGIYVEQITPLRSENISIIASSVSMRAPSTVKSTNTSHRHFKHQELQIHFISPKDQLASHLTKGLSLTRFQCLPPSIKLLIVPQPCSRVLKSGTLSSYLY